MTVVLEKVRRLERYVQATNGQVDAVLESTIDKLLGRERQRLTGQLARLKSQAAEFESRYGWTSEEFYSRFERGELGDDMDFIEWSATIEMISNLQSKWDAVNHHPELLHAPHHVHLSDGQVQGVNPTPDITTILDEIQANLKMESGTNA